MFDANKLASDPIQRIRLMAGDLDEFPLLEDSIYEYFYESNAYDEIGAAIEAVETIITMLVMNPTDETVGSNKRKPISVSHFKTVLAGLKNRYTQDKTKTGTIPMFIKSDKSNWNELNDLFKRS